jgi:hypothetical protein
MMMNSTNRKILTVLIAVDILLLGVAVIFFDIKVLYSTQIGYITATLVMIASIISYRRMVNARVKEKIITIDDSKDTIDKLEDPYDLYSEEVVDEEKSLAQTVKEEKKKLKKNRRSLYQTLKDTKAALSIYRLSSYALLIIGFLYLNRQQLLHIPAYIIALGIPSVILVWILIKEKEQENHSQD